MPAPLQYQPSTSAIHYTPPARIDIRRTILYFLLAALLGCTGAIIYAKILPNLSNPLLRGSAPIAAAGAMALIALIPVRSGRVRIPVAAAFLGALLALITLYVMWLVWVHDILNRWSWPVTFTDLLLHPMSFFRLIRIINRTGTWAYHGDIAAGFPLLLLWLIEAGLILAAGTLAPLKGITSDDPICRDCGTRCKYTPNLPRFAAEHEPALLAAIQNRTFSALSAFPPPAHEDAPELSLRLDSCPHCDATHVLTINRIAWVTQANRLTVKTTPLINQLLITPLESGKLKSICALIQEQRAADVQMDSPAPDDTPSTSQES